jgi:hypothetical protein
MNFDELKFFDKFKIFELLEGLKFQIAGGCFTKLFADQKPNDVDIFFQDEEELKKAIAKIKNDVDEKYIFENKAVLNFYIKGQKFQLIKLFFYKNWLEIFNDFDFTICKFTYDGKESHYHDRFFKDLAKRRLVIDNELLVKPLSTLQRVCKYTRRGFSMCPVGMLTLAKNINTLDINWDDPDENSLEFYPDGTPVFRGLD